MESSRLLIRPVRQEDEGPFTRGIADRALRVSYGFPADADETLAPEIFRHFIGLDRAFSLTDRESGEMIGFLLAVAPELPDEVMAGLPGKGRTLAYAVFPPFQRRGYMKEALGTVIRQLFQNSGTDYIHCGHFEENDASRELLRGLGFRELSRHTVNGRIIIDEILFPAP